MDSTEGTPDDIQITVDQVEDDNADEDDKTLEDVEDKSHDAITSDTSSIQPESTPAKKIAQLDSVLPAYVQSVMHQNAVMRRFSAMSMAMGPQEQVPIVFMERPQSIPGVPPGLEYLTVVDQLLVHQEMELLEIITGMETSNRYSIKNSMGQQIYYVSEESDLMQRQCCGPQRGFILHVLDNMKQEVMQISRKFKCLAGWSCMACCDGCSLNVVIETPVGDVIGHVTQKYGFLTPRFDVEDSDRQTVLKIEGPSCALRCCQPDQDFKILSLGGESVGRIQKQWGGFAKEYFTDADNFVLQFPLDMDAKTKTLLLGAVFLIDFMFFENKQGQT